MSHSSARLTLCALAALSLVGALLGGGAPQPTVTAVPPATIVVGPAQPAAGVSPATAGPPLRSTVAAPLGAPIRQAPAVQPTAIAAVPQPSPTLVVPTLQIEPHKPVRLTLPHTNDVFGEIDPCG